MKPVAPHSEILPAAHDIAALLPHAAPMILIDSLLESTENVLLCSANSHLKADNPLRIDGVLSVFAGVEYAAQAMAIHGRLSREATSSPPVRGFVAVASKLEAHVQQLDAIASPLHIRTERVASNHDSSLYTFTLHAGQQLLLEGQLMAVLEAAEPVSDF